MKLFGQLVRTVINVVIMPVEVITDVVTAPLDYVIPGEVGHRTKDRIQKLKDEASDD